MTHLSIGWKRRQRGFTLAELLVTAGVVIVLIAALTPALAQTASNGLRTVSLKNLVVLGESQACYAADWDGRQFAKAPDDFGEVNGNCSQYINTVVCPHQAMLGWGESGAMWGYYLGSSQFCIWGVGSCANMTVYRPIQFASTDAGFGFFRLPSLRGFQEYVGEKYYEKEWFSELDSVAWEAASQYFEIDAQFAWANGVFASPAYCSSPAALYHPEVFRRPSKGGFRDPDLNFPDSYDAPSVARCLHPELKTRMVEHSWLVAPPGPTNPAFSGSEPYYFNHGITSKPGALFFDGSVAEMTMKQAVADDAAMLKSTRGVDGLWSRDTPFGADGYFGAQAFDDTRNSFHILTTDGITGRDFLRRSPRGGGF